MRVFLTLLIIASVALSANAYSFLKREVPTIFQQCNGDMGVSSAELASFNNELFAYFKAVKAGNSPLTSDNLLSVVYQLKNFQLSLSKSAQECCSITGDIGADDSKVLFDTMTTLVLNIKEYLNTLTSEKEAIYGPDVQVNLNIKISLSEIEASIPLLLNCLADRVAEADKAKAKDYSDTLNKGLKDAQAAFGML